MTYKNLQQLLPNEEIHYMEDQEDQPEIFNSDYKFILFEYTCNFIQTIYILDMNNIKYTITNPDELNLQTILIK